MAAVVATSTAECPPYPYSYTTPDYAFGFGGAPFNFTINCVFFIVCIIIYIILILCLKKSKKFEREGPSYGPAKSCWDRFKRLIPYFLRLDQHEFARRAGLDSVAYILTLRFQVFQLFALAPLFALGTPLVNFSQDQKNAFRRLSIINLRLNDFDGGWKMWGLMLGCTLIYFGITWGRIVYMYRWPRRAQICRAWSSVTHQKQLKSKYPCECDLINKPTHVLMLRGLPECTLTLLSQVIKDCFQNLLPTCSVQWIRPAYSLKNIMDLDEEKTRLEQYFQLCLKQFESSGVELTYHDFVCGCLPNMGVRAKAIEVYKKRLVCTDAQLEALLLLYRIGDRRKLSSVGFEIEAPHSGIVFVGMSSPAEALELVGKFAPLHGNVLSTDYTLNFIDFCSKSPTHTEIQSLNELRKTNYGNILIPFSGIQLAPPASDLIWSNVVDQSCKDVCRGLRLIWIKVILFVFVFLCTIPSYVLTILTFDGINDSLNNIRRPFLLKFIPSGLLVVIATATLRITRTIESWSTHLTKSQLEKQILRNGYWMLFVVILVLPTLGIFGAPALYFYFVGFPDQSIMTNLVDRIRIECIFLPDTAILFLNFIVTFGVIGSSCQLLRLRYWFKFCTNNLCFAHSKAEVQTSHQGFPPYEFQFGESHAWIAFLQTIIVAYVPVCPILFFFGMTAYLFKFLIDKYMLVWVYKPKEVKSSNDSDSNMTDALSDQYLRVYHLNWVLESTRLSLVGICLGSINQLAFFALRYPANQQWPLILASAILALGTLVMSIIFSLLFSKSRWNHISLLHSNPVLNQDLNSRRQHLLSRESQESLTEFGTYSNQDAYTVPVLLKYSTDKSWYTKR